MDDKLSNKQYQAKDIQSILGIDRNRLFYWTHTHRFLVPETAGDGTGKKAFFSAKNLVELAFIKALLDFGTDMKKVKLIKDLLDESRDQFDGGNAFDYALKTESPQSYKMSIFISGKSQSGKSQTVIRVMYEKPIPPIGLTETGSGHTSRLATFFIPKGERPDIGRVSLRVPLGSIAEKVIHKER